MVAQLRKKEPRILDVPQILRQQIVETGEVSPDGVILRFKALNRRVEMGLVKRVADFMADWIRQRISSEELVPERSIVCVVESSGNMLAGFVGERLNLPVVIFKKGKSKTMFGEILYEKVHAVTRQNPTTICVERKDIKGKQVIAIDDFAGSGETLEALEKMAVKAGGKLVAIAVAVSKPSQGSKEIMSKIPSLSVVTIEKMTPATETEPAKIKFVGIPEQILAKKWGEG